MSDIIVAPATPVSDGGIAIIRLSGPNCLSMIKPFFKTPSRLCDFDSHRLYYGHFHNSAGSIIDEVMCVCMFSPRSYTGEDVAEIHCHGGRVVVRLILDTLLEAGCRMAQPGEFTQRAFLNGRIDLSKAEAVADIIASRSALSASIAASQLSGCLSNKIYEYRDAIIGILSLVEAYIDFPEDDMDAPHIDSIDSDLTVLLYEIDKLICGFEEGRIIKDGLSVLILGKPNVGKSSILNRLVGEERAIVTDIAGTTRDLIEESISFSGLSLRFIDTAGIRHTEDAVESVGVARAKSQISRADLVLFVVDGTSINLDDFNEINELLSDVPVIVLVNKSDVDGCTVPDFLDQYRCLLISAKEGLGFELLADEILDVFKINGSEERESYLISDRRHRDALLRCQSFLLQFKGEFSQGCSPEFLSIHLRDALSALGDITGETTPDEILNTIFSRFCVGK